MKKTNKAIFLIISGMLLGRMAYATQNAAPTADSGPTVASVEGHLAAQDRLNQEETKFLTEKTACISEASANGPPSPNAIRNCEQQYENKIKQIESIANRQGLVVPARGGGDISAGGCGNVSGLARNIPPKHKDNGIAALGSQQFKKCLEYTSYGWQDIVQKDQSNIWERGWLLFYKEQASNNDCNQLKESLEAFRDELITCEAYRQITQNIDYTDSNATDGGTPATKTSLDQKIKCQSRGAETQDYVTCVKTLNAYNAALVGTTVFTQVQELGYQGHAIENSVLDQNDPTAGLKAQKKDIEKRASMTQTRAGIDVAKGALLMAQWQSIPTPQSLMKQCRANNNAMNAINNKTSETANAAGIIGINPTRPEAIASSCNAEIRSNKNIFLNLAAKDALKQAMILAGIDGIKHSVAANLLKKQAGQVGKVINEVDNFNPTGLEYFGDEFNGSECALNPAAEGCDEFLNQRSFGFGSNAPIQIHGMQNASMFGRNDSEIAGGNNNAAASPVDRTDAPTPIGFFDVAANNPSGLIDTTRAAGVTSDGPGSGGGAGGGAGGGSAGGGGGGGRGAPSDAPRMGLPAAGTTNLAYSRGTGAIRGSGGRGAQGGRNSEGKAENPFAALFGAENANGANLNFREGASEEGQINMPDTSIFEIISGRYMAVHQNDRLLQYEAVEEDAQPLR